eukprot:m.12977 g.12977  ORF g.12977 m.12977 type:complete len:189 (+) comp2773_c0_seq2:75-641(+)
MGDVLEALSCALRGFPVLIVLTVITYTYYAFIYEFLLNLGIIPLQVFLGLFFHVLLGLWGAAYYKTCTTRLPPIPSEFHLTESELDQLYSVRLPACVGSTCCTCALATPPFSSHAAFLILWHVDACVCEPASAGWTALDCSLRCTPISSKVYDPASSCTASLVVAGDTTVNHVQALSSACRRRFCTVE